MGDLKDTRLMWLKAVLFLVIGALCAAGLLAEFAWRNALLLALCIWSFCRFYYFCFHVLEKYIDADFRFDGLFSVLIYIAKKRRS